FRSPPERKPLPGPRGVAVRRFRERRVEGQPRELGRLNGAHEVVEAREPRQRVGGLRAQLLSTPPHPHIRTRVRVGVKPLGSPSRPPTVRAPHRASGGAPSGRGWRPPPRRGSGRGPPPARSRGRAGGGWWARRAEAGAGGGRR